MFRSEFVGASAYSSAAKMRLVEEVSFHRSVLSISTAIRGSRRQDRQIVWGWQFGHHVCLESD